MKNLKDMKFIKIFCYIMITMIFFVGCSNDTKSSNGKTTVSMITNQDDMKLLQPVLDSFMEENENIIINVEAVKYSELDQKINLAHTSGKGYDIIMVNHTSIPQFVGGEVLENLNEYLNGSTIDLEKSFNESGYDIANVNGNQYAIPYGPDVRVLAYNQGLLDKVGADVPKTPADIVALGEAMEEQGAYLLGMDRKNVWDPIYTTGAFMLSMGANVYVKEGDNYIATVDTPEMIEYIEFVKDAYEYMPKDISVNEDQLRELFIQDKLAFYIFGTWEINNRIVESGVNYGLSLIPTTGISSSAMGGWLIGLGNNGNDKQEAWKLIEYIYEPKNMAALSTGLPPTIEAFDYEPYISNDIYDIFSEQLLTAKIPIAPHINSSKIAETYSYYFELAITGEMSSDEAVSKAQVEVEKLLN